jgi:hypothetical protein
MGESMLWAELKLSKGKIMKKLNVFLSLILILMIGTAASAEAVNDVISQATAAMGGQSAIDDVKSLKMNIQNGDTD